VSYIESYTLPIITNNSSGQTSENNKLFHIIYRNEENQNVCKCVLTNIKTHKWSNSKTVLAPWCSMGPKYKNRRQM